MGIKLVEEAGEDFPWDPSKKAELTRTDLIHGSLVYLFPGRKWQRAVEKKYCGDFASSKQLRRASTATLIAMCLLVFGIGFVISGFLGQRRVTEQLINGTAWNWTGWIPVALLTGGGLFVVLGAILACTALYMWVAFTEDPDCYDTTGEIPRLDPADEAIQYPSDEDSAGTVFATFNTPGGTATTTRIASKAQLTVVASKDHLRLYA